jgi:hypothetical protein
VHVDPGSVTSAFDTSHGGLGDFRHAAEEEAALIFDDQRAGKKFLRLLIRLAFEGRNDCDQEND